MFCKTEVAIIFPRNLDKILFVEFRRTVFKLGSNLFHHIPTNEIPAGVIFHLPIVFDKIFGSHKQEE